MLKFLKQHGFPALPLTNGFNFSIPSALQQSAIMVILSDCSADYASSELLSNHGFNETR